MGARTRAKTPHRDKSEEDRAKKAIATSTWRHGVVCTGERWPPGGATSHECVKYHSVSVNYNNLAVNLHAALHLSCSSDATVLVASAAAGLGLCLYSN